MLIAPLTLAALGAGLSVPISMSADPQTLHISSQGMMKIGDLTVSLSQDQGRIDLIWTKPRKGNMVALLGIEGKVALPNGGDWSTTGAKTHRIAGRSFKDEFGSGMRITVRHFGTDGRELRHLITIYFNRPEVTVQMEAYGFAGTRTITPILAQRVNTPEDWNRRLYVPYDNDAYSRYRSDELTSEKSDWSSEVSARFAPNGAGLIVGSIDHDVWKSGVSFLGGLTAFGGMADGSTRDSQPHGLVSGATIRSPRFALIPATDWRDGMEKYGEMNAKVQPALAWKGGVPFGWNSWSAHKAELKAENAFNALEFVAKELPDFRNDGTAYINFDSFWDNLTAAQRDEFVRRTHAAGLKAGIYWTPFVCWGKLDDRVGIGEYRYADLVLKDAEGNPLPKLDGGYPLDPTHPGTLARIDKEMAKFVREGYDFIKLDFMTHGALEAKHFDAKVQTGTQAYRIGMQRIVDAVDPKRIGRPFFISLSIAPLFPQGYGHSRRISCDAFADIGASEYMLNSATYGWWTANRLYRFNDPDHTVVYQAKDEKPTTQAEARTRFLASIVAGGMMLQGDDLGNPAAQARVKELFQRGDLLDIARKAIPFRPLSGDTGEKAGNIFYRRDGDDVLVAVFNYNRDYVEGFSIPNLLSKDGFSTRAVELLDNRLSPVGQESRVEIAPRDCALFRLSLVPMKRMD